MSMKAFSPEQSAGQRLMVGFGGIEFNPELRFLIDTLKVGGIVFFAGNLVNPEQIQALCASIQAYARSCGQPPLFIAIDQEGGRVARLKEPLTQFPGNPKMKGPEDAMVFARTTSNELRTLGINMNLAPVLDVVPEGVEGVMADRVFGPDPIWVSQLGVVVIEHLQANKIMAVAKHFPGIGRTILDSHLEMPDLETDADAMETSDLIPFQAAIKNNVAGIMLSHILYKKMDPHWPASLSTAIAGDLLRRRMGYGGLTMTDDLDMGAIKKNYDIHTVIRRILVSDIDIALICHAGPDIENAFKEILDAQSRSESIQAKGGESLRRISELKSKYLHR
ncbi:MAG: glycoside hydrolase family 3 protein [Deltaproteobacteria bacterium]|nr:glycoside hydrolase family 3 protein [Deltaproteobacteria bacterium]MBW1969274.1 glycoside hydrolase family 3 protein [Deltaproteobacteria bacterium]MBW2325887.1 glycoside hydrolase family 3 protein [Deltaproteobacteria bacterium]